MAHLPATVPEKTLTAAELSIVDALAEGQSVAQIARRLAPEDKYKRHKIRKKIWYRIRRNPLFQQEMVLAAKARALQEGVSSVPAVGRRARRGRVDAAKFLFEVSGIHNPRVSHDHSGEISVKIITAPRPTRIPVDSDVVDAEVVED